MKSTRNPKGLTTNQKLLVAQTIIMFIGIALAYLSYLSSVNSEKFYNKTVEFYNKFMENMNETVYIQNIQFSLSNIKDSIDRLKNTGVSNETIAILELDYIKASNLATEAISYKMLGNETAYKEKAAESLETIQKASKTISNASTVKYCILPDCIKSTPKTEFPMQVLGLSMIFVLVILVVGSSILVKK